MNNNDNSLLLKKRVIAQLDPEKLDQLQGGHHCHIPPTFVTCVSQCFNGCDTDGLGPQLC